MSNENYEKQKASIIEQLNKLGVEGRTMDLISSRNPLGDVEMESVGVLDNYLYHLQDQESKANPRPHSHYYKDVSKIDTLDVYRLITLFNVTDPCAQHILKKCLVQGGRGHKDVKTDMENIRDTAIRWLEMYEEDTNAS